MQQQELDKVKQATFINIRKLAALDIVFHGVALIVAEFAVAVSVCAVIGVASLLSFFRDPGHPVLIALIGFGLSFVAINYLSLLLYALSVARRKSATQEVAFELEHKEFYTRQYTLQSFLLVIPLVVPLLAISQEIAKRSQRA